MSRNEPTDEQYAIALDSATVRRHGVLLRALQTGCPSALKQIDTALGDYLQDEQAWTDLITKTIAGANPLQRVIADLVWSEAESDARAELDQVERDRPAAIAEDRAEREAWNRFMAAETEFT
jgi:hypothetical protein